VLESIYSNHAGFSFQMKDFKIYHTDIQNILLPLN
jgi:hypothetical protein